MNLFTRNSPYYHLLKYLLFLLTHPVYSNILTPKHWDLSQPSSPLPHGATAPSGPGSPHDRGFTITLRHTKFCRTPVDEGSNPRGDLYLTIHDTNRTRTSMSPAEFETVIPASGKHAVAHLVDALRYKSEGHGFDSRWCHWNFSLPSSFRPHYGPGFDSASNRNEYQEYLLGVKAAGG